MVTDDGLKQALEIAIDEYLLVRDLLKKAIKYMRQLSVESLLASVQKRVQTIPGMGFIIAMIVHTEIMDMER
jgi:hypothetical protein